MSIFATTNEQKVTLYRIAALMTSEGLPDQFVVDAIKIAEIYEGAFDLLVLWEEEGKAEKEDIIHDLQAEIDEFKEQPSEPVKKPYISFSDIELIAKDVISFKQHLRTVVDSWGGINKLSKMTGIPQPSLSKFFNSAAMPRRTTLYKIANAMHLSEREIIAEWAA